VFEGGAHIMGVDIGYGLPTNTAMNNKTPTNQFLVAIDMTKGIWSSNLVQEV